MDNLKQSTKLRQLIHRQGKVLVVLHPPTATHGRIMEMAGCECGFVGTSRCTCTAAAAANYYKRQDMVVKEDNDIAEVQQQGLRSPLTTPATMRPAVMVSGRAVSRSSRVRSP